MIKSKISKNNQTWFKKYHKDYYVVQAKISGYRSRAAYKLIELQQKYRLFKPGMFIVDLGAAPGSWSQVLKKYSGKKGKIIALDILAMSSIQGIDFIQGDFSEDKTYKKLMTMTGDKALDSVISDMSPNMSGNRITDQAQSMYLVELALQFAQRTLKKNGRFLTKIFQGEGFNEIIQTLREKFCRVIISKPHSSRPSSREVYVIAIKN